MGSGGGLGEDTTGFVAGGAFKLDNTDVSCGFEDGDNGSCFGNSVKEVSASTSPEWDVDRGWYWAVCGVCRIKRVQKPSPDGGAVLEGAAAGAEEICEGCAVGGVGERKRFPYS